MGPPLITAIVPAKNAMSGNERVDRLLASIEAQSYKNCEVIVVDGGSCDDTGAICRAYAPRCKYIESPGSISDAVNVGLDLAKGDFIILLDADMLLPPTLFEECVSLTQKLFAECVEIRDWYRASRPPGVVNGAFLHELEVGLGNGPLSILFYSRAIVGVTRMPPGLSFGEDYEFRQMILAKSPRVATATTRIQHFFDPALAWLVRRTMEYGRLMAQNRDSDTRRKTRYVRDNSLLKYPAVRGINTEEMRLWDPFFFPVYLLTKGLSFLTGYILGMLTEE